MGGYREKNRPDLDQSDIILKEGLLYCLFFHDTFASQIQRSFKHDSIKYTYVRYQV